MKKSVLMVNSSFDQDSTSGIRMSRFAKYLPEFGWSCYLLSWRDGQSFQHDINENITKHDCIKDDFLLDDVSSYPGQLYLGYKLAKEVEVAVERNNIDIVLHSCPPFIPLYILRILKRKIDIPYVVDFRDSWTPRYDSNKKTNVKSLFREKIEAEILENSDHLIMNTPKMEKVYSKTYKKYSHKYTTIPNGYDSEMVCNRINDPKKFTIIYPGRLRSGMDIFLSAFSKFVENHPDSKFIYYGSGNHKINHIVSGLGIEEFVEINSSVPRKKVFEKMSQSDIGLALTRSDDFTQVPTKIYDFIGSGLPIICLAQDDSATQDVLQEFPNTFVITRNNEEEIISTLRAIYQSNVNELGERKTAQKYYRYNLSKSLSDVLDNTRGSHADSLNS